METTPIHDKIPEIPGGAQTSTVTFVSYGVYRTINRIWHCSALCCTAITVNIFNIVTITDYH
jgi:hypothetical protein